MVGTGLRPTFGPSSSTPLPECPLGPRFTAVGVLLASFALLPASASAVELWIQTPSTAGAGARLRAAVGLVAFVVAAWALGRWSARRRVEQPPTPVGERSGGTPTRGARTTDDTLASGGESPGYGPHADASPVPARATRPWPGVPWRVVLWGLALQFLFALFVLRTPIGAGFFQGVDHLLNGILDYAEQGSRFIFGDLVFNNVPVGDGQPGNAPMTATGMVARSGAFFAFNVLTTIIFVSSLMAVLYHIGVMQWIVRGASWIMERTMGTSGAETLATAGNVFVGLMEAPLFVRPYLPSMTRSELMALMTGGFATVSGGTLAAYTGMLGPYFPGIGGHLVAASVMSAPAALVAAKLMLPEREVPVTAGGVSLDRERQDVNLVDAAARGASEGLKLALNVAAMLIAFLALLHLCDALVAWLGGLVGVTGLSLSGMLGWIMSPVAWLLGIPWAEAGTVGQLIGVKTVLNEFVAFLQLTALVDAGGSLSPRSATIAAYALAGFANFGSVAMQIGGIGELAPKRRADLAQLGIYAMVGGTLAALMTAAMASVLL